MMNICSLDSMEIKQELDIFNHSQLLIPSQNKFCLDIQIIHFFNLIKKFLIRYVYNLLVILNQILGNKYDLLANNCNHFAKRLAKDLNF